MNDGGIAALWERVQTEVGKVIVGQTDVLEQIVVAMLSGGHVLLEGVPGVAKTLLAKTLARTIAMQYGRVQFSPDLMPSDVIGTNIYNLAENRFHLSKGPIFTDLLLADEINRTPPKTQSALIEAMEERQVTIDGVRHPLSRRFFVIATQNPVEYEGTFPLPEAQVDRFLMKVEVTYPSEAEELAILQRHHQGLDPHDLDAAHIEQVIDEAAWDRAREVVRNVRVDESIMRYIRAIAARTRQSREVALGASPRAAIGILQASKTLAALRGSTFVTPDEVKSITVPVLRHRLLLRPEAEVEGRLPVDVLRTVLADIEVPR